MAAANFIQSFKKSLKDQPFGQTAHIVLIAVFSLICFALATYDSLWFDEAYSVGMARHSFPEIVDIGSADVHPVLYYFALHVLYMIFGPNVIVYRVFSVLGIAVLSLLGFTHCRKDFGPKFGFIFSLLTFLIPWCIHNAYQIRMYSWLSVAVMVTAIYGWRITYWCKVSGDNPNIDPSVIPCGWWIALGLSSIVAAYLHYYGAIAAFAIQFLVLVSIIRCQVLRARHIQIWALSALLCILAYCPWLFAVVSQSQAVARGFWISLDYPSAFGEILTFPFNSPEVVNLFSGSVSVRGHITLSSILTLVMLSLVFVLGACSFAFGVKIGPVKDRSPSCDGNKLLFACRYFGSVFIGTICITAVISCAIGQSILYFRYLAACIGPWLLVVSIVIMEIDSTNIKRIAWVIVAVFCILGYSGAAVWTRSPESASSMSSLSKFIDRATEMNSKTPLVMFEDWSYTVLTESGQCPQGTFVTQDKSYRAFEPNAELVPSYEEALGHYSGIFIFGGSYDEAVELANSYGGEIVDTESHFHPYSGNTLTLTSIKI